MASEVLRVISGDAAGSEVKLDGEFIVGRGEPGIGSLGNDTEISRRHARFRRTDDGGFTVEDLGSTNGTFVNGRRVTGPTVLGPGDEVTLGRTRVRFDGGSQATQVRAGLGGATAAYGTTALQETSAGVRTQPPPAARAAAPEAPAPPPEAPAAPPPKAPGDGPPRAGGPLSGPPAAVASRGPRLLADLLILLVVAGVIVAVSAVYNSTKGRAAVATDCGANIGKDGPVAFVSYVESNIVGSANNNSVLAIPYRTGDMKPLAMSQCFTGGSGATQLKMPGVIDGNDQVIVNQQHTLLFAVNQGSDSIAAFQIQRNGGLKPVSGSPFPSGGKAPSSLGISGNTLVVANKARDGVRDLSKEIPNYTTFNIAGDGKLTPVPGSTVKVESETVPTSAVVPNQGGVAFGLSDGGPIHTFSIDPSGALKEAVGSPFKVPPAVFGTGFDPMKQFALGVRAHPTKPYVYMALPVLPAIAVFSYDNTGRLKFVNAVRTAGAFLPCWIQITRDGRWLYTTSAGTNTITAFDITNPTKPKQIQNIGFDTPGNAWNIQLDPTDRFLVEISPRSVPAVPLGKGNLQHVMKIGPDGTLTEVNPKSPTKLPVPADASPVGVAVVVPGS